MHPIQKLCQEYNLSQTELAKKMRVDESTVRKWIKRNSSIDNITFGNICAIAKSLDLSLDKLESKLREYEKKD